MDRQAGVANGSRKIQVVVIHKDVAGSRNINKNSSSNSIFLHIDTKVPVCYVKFYFDLNKKMNNFCALSCDWRRLVSSCLLARSLFTVRLSGFKNQGSLQSL